MDPMDEDSPQPHHQQEHQQKPHSQEDQQQQQQLQKQPSDTPSQPNSASTSTTTPSGATPSAIHPPPRRPSAGTPASTGAQGQAADSSSSTTVGTPNAPSASLPASAPSKRRRGLGVVTPNACTECRKKRAKVRLVSVHPTPLPPSVANSPSFAPPQCDGQIPCGRCKGQKDVECVYEVPVRQSKENLRSEIETLRRQQRSHDSVLNALARSEQWEEVLRRLRAGHSAEQVSEWLGAKPSSGAGSMPTFGRPAGIGGNLTPMATFAGASAHSFTPRPTGIGALGAGGGGTGTGTGTGGLGSTTLSPVSTVHPSGPRQDVDPSSPWGTHSHFSGASQAHSTRSNSHPDVTPWGSGPPQTRVGRWVEDNLSQMHGVAEEQRYRGLDHILAPEEPQMFPSASTWTDITSNTSFVQHLLALYFCWEYPTFASLSKEHFLKDYQAGRPRYCSPMLVNALLALGCRFSSQPSTLANPNDPYSSGDHFFKECLRLYYEEDNHHNLTTIQALGIMSIREASCGRDSESWYYAGQSIRLAVEMGLHRISDQSGDSDEIAVQAATFWGAFSLDQ